MRIPERRPSPGLLTALALLLCAAAPPLALADDVGEGVDLEDVLGGFEEETEDSADTTQEAVEEPPAEPSIWDRFDLTGNIGLGFTYNYRGHRSENLPLRTD